MAESEDLISFWRGLQTTCSLLTRIVIRSLNFPVAFVDVKRSFSMKRGILFHKRTWLKLSSINTLSMMNSHRNLHNHKSRTSVFLYKKNIKESNPAFFLNILQSKIWVTLLISDIKGCSKRSLSFSLDESIILVFPLISLSEDCFIFL